jgi:hypothetical protein
MDIVVATDAEKMPVPAEVETLWRAASSPPPLNEPPSTASLVRPALRVLAETSRARDRERPGER